MNLFVGITGEGPSSTDATVGSFLKGQQDQYSEFSSSLSNTHVVEARLRFM